MKPSANPTLARTPFSSFLAFAAHSHADAVAALAAWSWRLISHCGRPPAIDCVRLCVSMLHAFLKSCAKTRARARFCTGSDVLRAYEKRHGLNGWCVCRCERLLRLAMARGQPVNRSFVVIVVALLRHHRERISGEIIARSQPE